MPHAGNARVVGHLEDGAVLLVLLLERCELRLGVVAHRAELPHAEAPAVLANALLTEKDGTLRVVDFDCDGDDGKKPAKEDEHGSAERHVEGALKESVGKATGAEPFGGGCRLCVGRATAHSLGLFGPQADGKLCFCARGMPLRRAKAELAAGQCDGSSRAAGSTQRLALTHGFDVRRFATGRLARLNSSAHATIARATRVVAGAGFTRISWRGV